MKNTIIMMSFLVTVLVVWLCLAFMAYAVSDLGYKECLTNIGIIYTMVIVGWVPAVIVACDVDKYLNR